jgi:hypothetical protein
MLRANLVSPDQPSRISHTGIPLHVVLMKQVCDESRKTREVLSSISTLSAKVDAMEDSLLGKIEVLMDRKALEAGNVTPHNLSVAVQQCFTNLRADLRAELQPLLGDRGIPRDGVRSHPPPGSMTTGEPTAYADAAVHTFPISMSGRTHRAVYRKTFASRALTSSPGGSCGGTVTERATSPLIASSHHKTAAIATPASASPTGSMCSTVSSATSPPSRITR